MSQDELVRLAELPFADVFAAHERAFVDYLVPSRPTPAELAELFRERGGRLEDSFGIVVAGEIAAFVVNASDPERALGYDVVTGTVPAHRGRGLARRLVEESARHLAGLACRAYRLEVLEANAPARRLYERAGFVARRELVGLTLPEGACAAAAPPGVAWRPLSAAALESWVARLGYEPSWQNDAASLARGLAGLVGLEAWLDGEPVAAGLAHARSGAVPLLVVDERRRGRGLGAGLLAELASRARVARPRFVNLVPGAGDEGIAWLRRRGAETVWRQLELQRRLGAPGGARATLQGET